MQQVLHVSRLIKEVTFTLAASGTVTEKNRPAGNESKRNNAENVMTFFLLLFYNLHNRFISLALLTKPSVFSSINYQRSISHRMLCEQTRTCLYNWGEETI